MIGGRGQGHRNKRCLAGLCPCESLHSMYGINLSKRIASQKDLLFTHNIQLNAANIGYFVTTSQNEMQNIEITIFFVIMYEHK